MGSANQREHTYLPALFKPGGQCTRQHIFCSTRYQPAGLCCQGYDSGYCKHSSDCECEWSGFRLPGTIKPIDSIRGRHLSMDANPGTKQPEYCQSDCHT